MTTADIQLPHSTVDLVGRAVHRHSRWSMDGIRERLFTIAFTKLVYAQIWEDPRVDLEALDVQPDSRIVTIASGGCNVLSYLVAKPARIFAVDLNATHVALLKLKLAAAQHLPDQGAFDRFFRHASDRENVTVYDTVLRAHLDSATREYWDGRDHLGRRRITRFAKGFYQYGLLGRFIGMAHTLARVQGRDPRKLLAAKTIDEQRAIYEAELAPLFNRRWMKRLIDSPLSLFGLGIPPAQFNELREGHSSASAVVQERLRRLACDFDIKTNYFAWQAFNRGYGRQLNAPVPPYLEAGAFEAVRTGADRIAPQQIDFIAFLKGQPSTSLDRYVLLDAQDWMSDDDLGTLWSELARTARPGARVIFRTAAPETPLPERVPGPVMAHWTYEAETSKRLHAQDRSAIYGGFHLYTLKASHT